MSKLEDLIGKKKTIIPVLDLSNNVIQTKEEFKRLMEKVPDYKMRPIKVRAEEIKFKEHDFSFKITKTETRKLVKFNGEREPIYYYPDPVPSEMKAVILFELCCVPIDWKMLTTSRPKLKQEEDFFSRMVEMGKLHLKTEARDKRDHVFNNCVKKIKNKSGILETRLLMCAHCGEEMCNVASYGVEIQVIPRNSKPWIKRLATHMTIIQELAAEDPAKYKNFFRMSDKVFNELLALVIPRIKKKTSNFREPISPETRLQVTLRYLALGCTFTSLSYLFHIPQNTISMIISEVMEAIYDALEHEFLKVPATPDEWKNVAKGFNNRWQFPNCIGAIDGKHVNMVAPPNSGSLFYNYKNKYSIVLMGIAESDYKLLYIDVGCPGRTSDGGFFNKCSFAKGLERNALNLPPPKPLPGRTNRMPFVLIGDDAFALSVNLLKPFSNRTLVYSERIYNYRLSCARRIIENLFGIMASRFRILRSDILLDSEKTTKVAKACCALHNFLMVRNEKQYAPDGTFDTEMANGEIVDGTWRTEADLQPVNHPPLTEVLKLVKSVEGHAHNGPVEDAYIFHMTSLDAWNSNNLSQ